MRLTAGLIAMPPNADQPAAMKRFMRQRELAHAPLRLKIERRVCVGDYGATSWTTRDGAGRVAELLRLGPGKLLLDIGAGAGWPRLHFAATTGCAVVLTDIPFYGLQAAVQQAEADGLRDAVWVAAADGAALPFTGGCFDPVNHSDVCVASCPSRRPWKRAGAWCARAAGRYSR